MTNKVNKVDKVDKVNNVSTAHIRQLFIDFFKSKGHINLPSSSLVPASNDNTLLFTNAGMNQFKEIFLGQVLPLPYTKVVTAQKCVRSGGKHNDLNNVGFTSRHHTFFEMLGNFSFGDYFKEQAITYAWEFLVQVLQLPANRLYVTVYDKDDESYNIWHDKVGLSKERIIKIGDNKDGGTSSDNFWQMGDTGPCGPCTEIFFDHGAHLAGDLPGCEQAIPNSASTLGLASHEMWTTNENVVHNEVATHTPSNSAGDERYVEIWNCVFMQYNRDADGKLHPLAMQSVDTGMGLERISAVMQHVNSNYDIDLFVDLISSIKQLVTKESNNQDIINAICHSQLSKNSLPLNIQQSMQVLADHIRSVSFLIADGVLPSNEGRGYVLRRIIRRASLHGYKLGILHAFFHLLVAPLVNIMGDMYTELKKKQEVIIATIQQEEQNFLQTLDKGMKLLKQELSTLLSNKQLSVDLQAANIHAKNNESHALLQNSLHAVENKNLTKELDAQVVFKLYDTYGFPVDLTEVICHEYAVNIDMQAFEQLMAKQKQLARDSNNKFTQRKLIDYHGAYSQFIGYENESITDAIIVMLYNDKQEALESLRVGDSGIVVLDRTVCYPEGGGQIGDSGIITAYCGDLQFIIDDTKYIAPKVIGHIGRCVSALSENSSGKFIDNVNNSNHDSKNNGNHDSNQSNCFTIAKKVSVRYNKELRLAAARNHSVTHLLHKALHLVLGDGALQRGSLVCPHYTRFDFAYNSALSHEQLVAIEKIVNDAIMANYSVKAMEMTIKQAMNKGALALFDDKYGDWVRVIAMAHEQYTTKRKSTEQAPTEQAPTEHDYFSLELCGGTHVSRTGDIGMFFIRSQSAVASGVRRIEAVTANVALQLYHDHYNYLTDIKNTLLAQSVEAINVKLANLLAANEDYAKEINSLTHQLAEFVADQLCAQVEPMINRSLLANDINGDFANQGNNQDNNQGNNNNACIEQQNQQQAMLLVAQVTNYNSDALVNLSNVLQNKLLAGINHSKQPLENWCGNIIIILLSRVSDKLQVVVHVCGHKEFKKLYSANKIIRQLSSMIGVKGGGRDELAKAGGAISGQLPQTLKDIKRFVKELSC